VRLQWLTYGAELPLYWAALRLSPWCVPPSLIWFYYREDAPPLLTSLGSMTDKLRYQFNIAPAHVPFDPSHPDNEFLKYATKHNHHTNESRLTPQNSEPMPDLVKQRDVLLKKAAKEVLDDARAKKRKASAWF